MKALLAVLALAGTAHAYPVFVATDEEPRLRDPDTKLGFRLGFGRVPLDEKLAWSGLTIGVEHAMHGKLRMLAEYDFLWLATVPADPAMPPDTSTGHRTNVGFRFEAMGKDLETLKFFADVEIGGGVGLYDAPSGAVFVPHGFVGVRLGYQLRGHGSASRTFEPEASIRALVVEGGIGVGGGFGFLWGD